jgi:hypothetical protein
VSERGGHLLGEPAGHAQQKNVGEMRRNGPVRGLRAHNDTAAIAEDAQNSPNLQLTHGSKSGTVIDRPLAFNPSRIVGALNGPMARGQAQSFD